MSNNQFDKLIELIQQYLEQLSNNELKIIAASLSGVVLGFLLYVFKDWLTDRKINNKKKSAILNELRTNLGLIGQKKDILNKLIIALKGGKISNTTSAGFSTSLYDKHIGDVGMDLNIIQLSCLHVIYEQLKFVDKYMNNFFNEYIEKSKSGILPNIFTDSMNECSDVIGICDLLNELIEGYLEGKPKDILWEDEEVENTKKEFKESSDPLRDLLDNIT